MKMKPLSDPSLLHPNRSIHNWPSPGRLGLGRCDPNNNQSEVATSPEGHENITKVTTSLWVAEREGR